MKTEQANKQKQDVLVVMGRALSTWAAGYRNESTQGPQVYNLMSPLWDLKKGRHILGGSPCWLIDWVIYLIFPLYMSLPRMHLILIISTITHSCKIAKRGFSLKVYLKNSVCLTTYGSKTDSGCIYHSFFSYLNTLELYLDRDYLNLVVIRTRETCAVLQKWQYMKSEESKGAKGLLRLSFTLFGKGCVLVTILLLWRDTIITLNFWKKAFIWGSS